MSMYSYTCAKTHVPIRCAEMGDVNQASEDDRDPYARYQPGYEEHPRKLMQIRYWEEGRPNSLTGQLAGENLWLLKGVDGDGNRWPPFDLEASGLHDKIMAGTAFVLAIKYCGEVPEDFRGISHDDPGQGDLMLDPDLADYIDERKQLPSYDVLILLYEEALPLTRAKTLDDETLLRLGELNRRICEGVKAGRDPDFGVPISLLWKVGRTGSLSFEVKHHPEIEATRIRSEADVDAAVDRLIALSAELTELSIRKREYAVPSMSDIQYRTAVNKCRQETGLKPFWLPDVDPELLEAWEPSWKS